MSTPALDLIASHSSDDVVVATADGDLWTRDRFQPLLDRWAAVLDRPKSLVGIVRPRSAHGLSAYVAALQLGHCIVLVEDPAADLSVLADGTRPELVLGSERDLQGLQGLSRFIALDPAGSWGFARPSSTADVDLYPDLAVLIRTSGSSGRARGVRLSYGNVHSNASAIATVTSITGDDRGVTSLRMDFSFGLSVVNSHLLAGASLAVVDASPSSSRFWQDCSRSGATTFAAIPTTYRHLLASRWTVADHPRLRKLLLAGGRLEAADVDRLRVRTEEAGAELYSMYGQTEATARIACLPPSDVAHFPGSVGAAVPGSRLRIDDGHGQVVPDGSVGEVVFSGPGVMMGYATCVADLALGDTVGGTIRTGDVGRVEAGRLYLLGRADRQVKVLGLKVDLQAVETLASNIIGAETSACLSGSDLITIVGEGRPLTRAELRSVGGQFHLPPGLLRTVQVERLPRTRAGKIDHGSVEKMATATRDSSPPSDA